MLKITLSDYSVIYVKSIGEAMEIAHNKGQRIRKVEGE